MIVDIDLASGVFVACCLLWSWSFFAQLFQVEQLLADAADYRLRLLLLEVRRNG